jgi:FtsP/CotA-like multicopper oxidase with cupredoxin domain
MTRSRALTLVGFLIAWPSAATAQPTSLAPTNWDQLLKLPEAHDDNPDPRIVEIDLTARIADVDVAAGHTVRAWTYDGGIPGPLIRAHVGDRVIVHFTNDLPQPTTIHWHGVRVPIEMDGVPDISQTEVKGGETFTYDFVVRDAGLYCDLLLITPGERVDVIVTPTRPKAGTLTVTSGSVQPRLRQRGISHP